MTCRPLSRRRLRALGSILAAALFLAVACEADPPVAPAADAADDKALSAVLRRADAQDPNAPSVVVRVRAAAPMGKLPDDVESGRVEVFIDGARATPDAVRALLPDEIASIEVRKGSRLAITPEDDWAHVEGRIYIRTKGERPPVVEGRLRAERPDPGALLDNVSPDVVITIDGRAATKAEAASLRPDDIARIEVVKQRGGAGAGGRIAIWTKAGGGA